MLRLSRIAREEWKEFYHRINIPRRAELQRHMRKLEAKKRAKGQLHEEQSYKYNRWFVSQAGEFVHQEAVVEDPDVMAERRKKLPKPTQEDTWKKPHKPFFEPLLPYAKVMDYPKDPDVKFLRPINVPRWKDYMIRTKPMPPRTWY